MFDVCSPMLVIPYIVGCKVKSFFKTSTRKQDRCYCYSNLKEGAFLRSGQIMSSNSYFLLDVIFIFTCINFTTSFLQMKKIFFTIVKFEFQYSKI